MVMRNIYYFTDIHGQYDLYDAIVRDCFDLDPECILVFGGDACDRGEYGYRIMRELLNNLQIIYLKGNHEDMFVRAAYAMLGFCGQSDELYIKLHSKQLSEKETVSLILSNTNPDIILYLSNGGLPTLLDWIVDGADEEFVEKIAQLPLTFSYNNIDFCHAGAKYEFFKEVNNNEYYNLLNKDNNLQTLLWDRTMLPLGWETGRICVFGHTPTISLPIGIYGRDLSLKHIHPCAWQDKMGAKNKRGGWKIDMDTAAAWSNRAYMLNCNNMQVTGYQAIIDKNENCIIKIVDQHKII